MDSKFLISLILSVALLLYTLYFFIFTKKINAINEKIFYLYYAEQFDFNDEMNVRKFTIVLNRFLEPQIKRKLIDKLVLNNPNNNDISVTYEIKYMLRRSLLSFDLIKMQE